MHNLKTRILIPLTLTLAILFLGFVVSFYRIQNKHLTAKVIKKLASVENLFAAQLANDAQMMGVGLEMSLCAKKLLKRTHHQKNAQDLGGRDLRCPKKGILKPQELGNGYAYAESEGRMGTVPFGCHG